MSSSGSVVYKLLAIILTKKVKQTYVFLNEEILVTSSQVHHFQQSAPVDSPEISLPVTIFWNMSFRGSRPIHEVLVSACCALRACRYNSMCRHHSPREKTVTVLHEDMKLFIFNNCLHDSYPCMIIIII